MVEDTEEFLIEDVPEDIPKPKPEPIVPDHTKSSDSPFASFIKSKREKKSDDKERPPPMPRPGIIGRQISDIYMGFGTMMMPFDPYCGNAIIQAAEECGKSVEKMCKTNPAFRRFVLKFLETSVFGEAVIAHLPILIAVMMHHVPSMQRNVGKMMRVEMPDDDRDNESAA